MKVKYLLVLTLLLGCEPRVTADTSEHLQEAAQVEVQAKRVDPPELVGLNGMPFAPAGLDRCDEMSFYRAQAGLPEYMDRIGFGESSCKNYVKSWCCYGYFQLYVSIHLKDNQLGPLYYECGIYSVSDIFSDDDDTFYEDGLKKQKNACGAAAVLKIQGCGAWDVC